MMDDDYTFWRLKLKLSKNNQLLQELSLLSVTLCGGGGGWGAIIQCIRVCSVMSHSLRPHIDIRSVHNNGGFWWL